MSKSVFVACVVVWALKLCVHGLCYAWEQVSEACDRVEKEFWRGE